MTINWNFNLKEAGPGERVFLLLRKGEKGNGELAVGMLCPLDKGEINCYWTWGGPNSGSDIDEVPVAWAPLPENWYRALVQ